MADVDKLESTLHTSIYYACEKVAQQNIAVLPFTADPNLLENDYSRRVSITKMEDSDFRQHILPMNEGFENWANEANRKLLDIYDRGKSFIATHAKSLRLLIKKKDLETSVDESIAQHHFQMYKRYKMAVGEMLEFLLRGFDGIFPKCKQYENPKIVQREWVSIKSYNIRTDSKEEARIARYYTNVEAIKQYYRIDSIVRIYLESFRITVEHFRVKERYNEIIQLILHEAEKTVTMTAHNYCVRPAVEIKDKRKWLDIWKECHSEALRKFEEARDDFMRDLTAV